MKTKDEKQKGIYTKILITKQIPINIINVGKNIKKTIEEILKSSIEGKCIEEGFIKANSIKIITYSSGLIQGSNVIFEVVFECFVCCPVEGMHIRCVATNITKAGIRAETNEDVSPVVIFIARDHHYKMEYFSKVKQDDTIKVRVIGQRFELNDKYISIIAELIEPHEKELKSKRTKQSKVAKPTIVIDN